MAADARTSGAKRLAALFNFWLTHSPPTFVDLFVNPSDLLHSSWLAAWTELAPQEGLSMAYYKELEPAPANPHAACLCLPSCRGPTDLCGRTHDDWAFTN